MQAKNNLLQKINTPADIKNLNVKELYHLADEIREKIVSVVSNNGGHLSSNLGVVELTIALHKVFNSPDDKIIWDVGHQCYAHKILTGRLFDFDRLRKKGGLSGFPKNSESPHDVFNTGHASTSVSAALGILAAQKMNGINSNVIAVIGDGALTGGLAYEALSHAGHLALPLIVILNDNKMSINANVGGLSKYLSRLSMKAKYQTFRRHFDSAAQKIPFWGDAFYNFILRLKRAVKAVFYTDNFFVDLGFEYVGPIAGHNINDLINVFHDVRRLNRPVVIHVLTRKGKGYGFAEDEPDYYHGVNSFSINDGIKTNINIKKSFTESFAETLLSAASKNKKIIALTAAMTKGAGLSKFAETFPDRFFDVGIAEEHAVTFAAGLAVGGLKPVVAIYSTFIQRAVDQIIHDTALQKLPVIFALDRAGLVGDDGETHQGLFDIALFRSVPDISILAPSSDNELRLMFEWVLEQKSGPIVLRYPKAYCSEENQGFIEPIENGKGVWVSKNGKAQVCLAFTGGLYTNAFEAHSLLKLRGIEADLYNLRFLKPINENYLIELLNSYKLVGFLEEGIKEGGFSEYAAALAGNNNCKSKISIMAIDHNFTEKEKAIGTRDELISLNGLDGKGIAEQIETAFRNIA